MSRQLDASEYADMVLEFLAAENIHDRYRLRSLVAWHVPTPWYSWSTFLNCHMKQKEPAR